MSKYSQVLDENQLSKFLEECEDYQVSTGTGRPSDKQIAEEQLATLLRLTERYCVVYQSLRNPPPIEVTRAVAEVKK